MSNQALKGAVIGYGFISSKGHIPAYEARKQKKNDVEILAIADICEGRRSEAARMFPKAEIFKDGPTLLSAMQGKLDFVDISTPPCDHASLASEALKKGMHVLCEKPLTTTLEQASDLLKLAKSSERVIFPCHNYKHAPVVKAIRAVIDSGRIGKVRSVTLNTYRNTHAKGVTEWNTHWRRDHKFSGGGIAMDHGSHTFYLTFDWLNSYPTHITAKMSNLDKDKYDTEDNFTSVLTFPTGLAHVHLSWTAGIRKVIYTIQGEKGGITVDDDDMQVSVQERSDGPDVAQGAVKWKTERVAISSDWMDASHVTWFNSLFDQFKEAIEKKDFVGKEALESYRCIELITTAYRSALEGCVELPLKGIS